MPRRVPVRDLSHFGRAARSQGRTYAWLAEQSGYTAGHITRVANGVEPGTMVFHKAMWRILGMKYKLPREVLS